MDDNTDQGEIAPEIGLALGGGGARGIAHIHALAALEELGLKADIIAGTSIGAIMGAAAAAGMTAQEITDYGRALFADRTALLKRIMQKWPGTAAELFNPFSSSLFKAETLFEILLPDAIPAEFALLPTRFMAIATDYYGQSEVRLDDGALIPAIAASCALPALFQPVAINGRVLIDGGFVNPLPFDALTAPGRLTIAIDVNGQPAAPATRSSPPDPQPVAPLSAPNIPKGRETLLGMTQIILGSLIREKLKNSQPDILMRPDVGSYRVLDFYQFDDILSSTAPLKDELKHAIDHHMKLPGLV